MSSETDDLGSPPGHHHITMTMITSPDGDCIVERSSSEVELVRKRSGQVRHHLHADPPVRLHGVVPCVRSLRHHCIRDVIQHRVHVVLPAPTDFISYLRQSEKASTPYLEMQYGERRALPIRPYMLAIITFGSSDEWQEGFGDSDGSPEIDLGHLLVRVHARELHLAERGDAGVIHHRPQT
ncbi:hypothetical protein DNTS_018060 [Danionella cerebrum]|uniref:Uncharacterized protein n=1 Tax=Danionella cerebrum TaxID=2873325 RepID=A0A553QGS2_9TELE|nr:hypothetical protein DNTS_018060 [Danionella translucida]